MIDRMFFITWIVLLVTFTTTFFVTKWWIRRAQSDSVGLVGRDMNKPGRKLVAEMGGLPVLVGFVFGLWIYVFYNTFFNNGISFSIKILVSLLTVVLAGIIGIMDDLLGWKIGIKPWYRIIIFLFLALPIIITNIDREVIGIPFIGNINFSIFYSLVIIPILICGFANGFNLLGGYNGLEGGMGIIIFSVLGFVSLHNGLINLAMIAFIMVAALLAFLYFNWYPAEVFPGNILSCVVGTLIAVVAIWGSMEVLALFLFIPYFMDLFFLFRAKTIKVEAFAKPKKDGSIDLPYPKCYDTTHLAINILKKFKSKVYEWEVVSLVLGFEIVLAVVGLVVFL